jgi:hypothetical protein
MKACSQVSDRFIPEKKIQIHLWNNSVDCLRKQDEPCVEVVIGTLQVLKPTLPCRSHGSKITILIWESVCVGLCVCVCTQSPHKKSVRFVT